MLQAGTHLHDRYRVLRRIGRGGMGAVYEAVDTRLHNTVAVKQLELAGAVADRAFEREAQLLAGLRHPALPVVIDYFMAAADAFLVMQYIEGEDLEQHLGRHQRPCERDEVIAWANALLDGLEYLHSRSPSIIHRDIKPANVKRTPAGDVVLLDFGLAKGRLDADETEARDNSLYGFTLQYAPLEQIDGLGTDVRSDLFALGATLYHLATGAPPPTALQRSMAIRNGLPDPMVPAHVIHAPVGLVLSAALVRAMALDPADRFSSAAEMRSALSVLGAPTVVPAEPITSERRVDAALPSQVEAGRQTDMIVQVRFAESPLLGIEDWPTKRRPDQIEQSSEPLQVTHLVDPVTGRLAPARVRIKIASSDFVVDGDPERLIEVPVDAYSKRMAFLLTPRRTGFCRVNVEVYALDSLYLGTVAVEAEAISAAVAETVPNVAHMVLGAFSREAERPKKSAVSATADTVRIKITPELAAVIAAPPVAAPVQREAAMAATMVGAPPPIAPAPSAVAAPPQPPRPAAAHLPVPPPVSATPKASLPPPRASLASRLPMFGSAAAVILIAGLVFTVWPKFAGVSSSPPEQSTTPDPVTAPAVTQPAPPAAPVAAPAVSPPPTASKPAAAATKPAATARPTVSPLPPAARRPVTAPLPATPAPATTARPAPTPPPPSIPEPTPAPRPMPAPVAPAPERAAPPPPPVALPTPAAPAPAPAAPPPPAAAAQASNAGGSTRVMEAAKKLEQSGELAQALAEYERARQLLEADVARLKEALQNGLVTARRVEAVEATLTEATQSMTRVRARLDAQRRRK